MKQGEPSPSDAGEPKEEPSLRKKDPPLRRSSRTRVPSEKAQTAAHNAIIARLKQRATISKVKRYDAFFYLLLFVLVVFLWCFQLFFGWNPCLNVLSCLLVFFPCFQSSSCGAVQ